MLGQCRPETDARDLAAVLATFSDVAAVPSVGGTSSCVVVHREQNKQSSMSTKLPLVLTFTTVATCPQKQGQTIAGFLKKNCQTKAKTLGTFTPFFLAKPQTVSPICVADLGCVKAAVAPKSRPEKDYFEECLVM